MTCRPLGVSFILTSPDSDGFTDQCLCPLEPVASSTVSCLISHIVTPLLIWYRLDTGTERQTPLAWHRLAWYRGLVCCRHS
ncbi:hypothetical protein PoB_007707400 [Plakobranchus ocellatus]|uniref:Ig-like domain-containing protein n=1 Tax=Plakobranchus ocellatus TaxID=259542 RepID=A0AAV4E2U1_9GAST|nr:hypothetical protein PoB_007707400 [Plakobranchus ocellatus]